jgi:3-deoxy-D-manno-octulosonic-acid transferase
MRSPKPFSLTAYQWLMSLFHTQAPFVLRRRLERGKEDPIRFRERLGRTDTPRPSGTLIWLHGVSVGESLSVLPVIERLKMERPDVRFLLTTSTTTSAEILAKRLAAVGDITHQYAPIDTPQAVAAFLDHWQPDLAIFIESDLWPNLIGALQKRGIKHALLSARITEKTYKGWMRLKEAITYTLSGFDLIMAQDKDSEARLKSLGDPVARHVAPQANLKTLGAPLEDDATTREALSAQIGARQVIVAASTHPTEDAYISSALEAMVKSADKPLLIIVPRHPIRAEDIRLDLEALGFTVGQRSKAEGITPDTQIYLADTLGELGVFFRLADVVIMAGSFSTGIGGHNPLEAMRLSKAVVFGPELYNWQAVYDDVLELGAGWKTGSRDELSLIVEQLLANPQAREAANTLARRLARKDGDTLPMVWRCLEPLLPPAPPQDEAA